MEFVVISRALNFLHEPMARAHEIAFLHRVTAAIEKMKRRVGLQLRQPNRPAFGFALTPQRLQHQNHVGHGGGVCQRSEEHTSELHSLMRNSYDVFWLKKKNTRNTNQISITIE